MKDCEECAAIKVLNVKLTMIEKKLDRILKTNEEQWKRINKLEHDNSMAKGGLIVLGTLWAGLISIAAIIANKIWK